MTIHAAIAAIIVAAATAIGGTDGSYREPVLDGDLPRMPTVTAVGWGVQRSASGSSAHGYSLTIHNLAASGIALPPAPVPDPPVVAAPPEPNPTIFVTPAIRSGFEGEITHYGEGYNGQTMGCPGAGAYWSGDTSIAAVGPSRYGEWPCGTRFVVTGPAGSIEAYRQDSCPGCHHTQLDLSESGMIAVCGYLGRCPVWIEVR